MSPAAKVTTPMPLSSLPLLSPELEAIFQETGAETVTDMLIQITPSTSPADADRTLSLRLETRLTPELHERISMALLRIRRADSSFAREQASRWTAFCGEWCEAIVRDGLLLLKQSDSRPVFQSLRWPTESSIRPSRTTPPPLWDGLTPEQAKVMVSCTQWLLQTGLIPEFFPDNALKPEEVSLAITLYLQKLPPEYVLRIVRQREPKLLLPDLIRRRDELLMRLAAIGWDILSSVPPANEVEMEQRTGQTQNLQQLVRDCPTWYVNTVKALYPNQTRAWTPPSIPFYERWVAAALEEVTDPFADSMNATRIFLYDPRLDRRDMAGYAAQLHKPLRVVEEMKEQADGIFRKKEMRDLILEPPPHGTLFHTQCIPYIPGEALGDIPLEMLHLDPRTLNRLRQNTTIENVCQLAAFLWRGDPWREIGIDILGFRNYFSLRIYLNYLGIRFDFGPDAVHLRRDIFYISCLHRILDSSMIPELEQIEFLAACLTVRRCLLGYQEVEQFEATEAGWMAVNGVWTLGLLPKTMERILEKRGLDLGMPADTFLTQTAERLAPVVHAAIRRMNLHFSHLSPSKQKALLQNLSEKVYG